MASTENIPSLDLAHFIGTDAQKRTNFVKDLGNAFTEFGFVAIKNHGLSDSASNELYDSFIQFFSLPQDVKAKYDIAGLAGQRGYTGKGKEHAKGRNIGDLKEFYHVGQEKIPGDSVTAEYPDNIFPTEIPQLEKVSMHVFKTLENAGINILRAISLFLGLPEQYFDDKVQKGNSILRAIHYYPIEDPDSVPDGAVRAAEHGDINLITLLMGASADGLQIQRRDGTWIPVTALPEQIVVNVGDMLERHTNDVLRSTIHRVVNPPREKMGTSRYSMPFFMHPRSDMSLACLPQCISAERPKKYEDITAGEFLDERLYELGLKK
jgi:isopenicillin N synthase-like dioxygenase